MLNRFTLFFASFIASVCLISCEKSDEETEKEEIAASYQTNYPVLGFSSYHGVLAAIKDADYRYNGVLTGQTEKRTVNAFFYSDAGVGPFVSGGFVRINDTLYTKMDGADGVYYPINTAQVKIEYNFDDTLFWSVTGNTDVEIRPFSDSIVGFPSQPIPDTNLYTIPRDKPFVMKMLNTLEDVNDSAGVSKVKTVFAIRQGDKTLSHEASAVSTQYQFTSNELKTLEKGEAIIEIGAYRYRLKQVDGKYFYLVNGSRSTRKVNVQ